jgi:signal transduction histidine kinase
MPVSFSDLSSFDRINLGATLIQAAVMIAFAVAVAGVWLTHRRPAMRALTGYWALFGVAAVVNIFSSWSGAIWRDRVLSLSLTTVVVALHAAAVPFAYGSLRRLSRTDVETRVSRLALGAGMAMLLVHGGGIWAALTWWPEVRLVPVILSRSLHAAVFLAPVWFAYLYWRSATQNRKSVLLLALGLSVLAVRGFVELALGLRVGKPDLSAVGIATAIVVNLLGIVSLGVVSLIAMAAEEQEVVRRQGEELRRAEQSREQGQRLESLGRLAGGVAHDFNNILAVVMAMADSLRREARTPRQKEDVESLAGAAERGRGLVKQLLTFARQQPAPNDTFDVNAQLQELRSMLQRLAGDVTLQLTAPVGTIFVRLDRTNFDQLMLNLVANARDASPTSGRVELSLQVCPSPRAGVLAARSASSPTDRGATAAEWVCLAVEDFGTGIASDVLPYVFEPFFSTKPTDLGTGLGLATVLGIVARAGGDVVVDSEAGRGTRFEIWLPRVSGAVPLAPVPV